MTKIEWADKTLNPMVGCAAVSPGCQNCYAILQARRLAHLEKYAGLTEPRQTGRGRREHWTGQIAIDHGATLDALKRRRPTRYFVNSMGDFWFDGQLSAREARHLRRKLLVEFACAPRHQFLILTKRPQAMRDEFAAGLWRDVRAEVVQECRSTPFANLLSRSVSWSYPDRSAYLDAWPDGAPAPNIWLGVSVENQATAIERLPLLVSTPAPLRFVSCEPLLGEVTLWAKLGVGPDARFLGSGIDAAGKPAIDWVIAGGESGPGARCPKIDWFRALRDQCAWADVPFMFKQWGNWAPDPFAESDQVEYRRSRSKHESGRTLDGIVWDQSPDWAPGQPWRKGGRDG